MLKLLEIITKRERIKGERKRVGGARFWREKKSEYDGEEGRKWALQKDNFTPPYNLFTSKINP